MRHAVNAAVDQAGEAARRARCRAAGCAKRRPDRLVHALRDARHPRRGLRGELRHAAQVGGTQMLERVLVGGFHGLPLTLPTCSGHPVFKC